MKFLIKLILLILIIAGGVFIYFAFISPPVLLSSDQEKVRETFGLPEQFMITYLPRGSSENPQAVRSEVWYYPKQAKQINFLAGQLAAVEDFTPEEEIIGPTSLRPEDFDVYMGYDEVAQVVGEMNLERFEMPGFFDEEVETYVSDQALFIIEDGYLTYVQTIGVGSEIPEAVEVETETEAEAEAEEEPAEEDIQAATTSEQNNE